MESKYHCDQCDKEMKLTDEIYETTTGYVCESCYMDAVERAEYAWESAKEEGRI